MFYSPLELHDVGSMKEEHNRRLYMGLLSDNLPKQGSDLLGGSYAVFWASIK